VIPECSTLVTHFQKQFNTNINEKDANKNLEVSKHMLIKCKDLLSLGKLRILKSFQSIVISTNSVTLLLKDSHKIQPPTTVKQGHQVIYNHKLS
jgi:hypothetical protein